MREIGVAEKGAKMDNLTDEAFLPAENPIKEDWYKEFGDPKHIWYI